jgi:lysophospholipase L1-like esterase
VFLTVPDVAGTYTLPYIQSSPHLEVAARSWEADTATVRLRLSAGARTIAEGVLSAAQPKARLEGLPPGQYVLVAQGSDASGRTLWRQTFDHIGIGTILAALGDSITEGYYGRGFRRGEHLHAGLFPTDAVSRDGRNFPQHAPTTSTHLPEVNCFESWMTDLNDLLAQSWRQDDRKAITPVLIANEGWGGYQTGDYLNLVHTDRNWQERMRLLQPQVWLVHLGVNDERAQVAAPQFAANLEVLVGILLGEYGAHPERILIAKPSYDYAEGAEKTLLAYGAEIDALIERRGLSAGADFFAAYSQDRERWYGEDPVHPNEEGMKQMARVWHEAIVRALPAGGGPP